MVGCPPMISATWRPPAHTTVSADVDHRIDLTAADSPGEPDVVELDDDSVSTEDLSQPKMIRSAAKQGAARHLTLLTSSDDEEGTDGATGSHPNSCSTMDAAKEGEMSANRHPTNCGTTNITGSQPSAGPKADKPPGMPFPSAGASLSPKSPRRVTPWAAFAEGMPCDAGFMVVSRDVFVAVQPDNSALSKRQGATQPSASPQANSPPAKPAARPLGAGLGGSKPSVDRQGSTAAAGSHAAGGEPTAKKKAAATAQSPGVSLGNKKKLPANKDTSSATSQPSGVAANGQDAASTGMSIQPERSARPTATQAPAQASAQPRKLLQPAGSGGVTIEVGAAQIANATAPSLPAPLPSPSLGPVSGLGGSNLLIRRPKPPPKQQASSQPSGGASASLMDSKPVRTLP